MGKGTWWALVWTVWSRSEAQTRVQTIGDGRAILGSQRVCVVLAASNRGLGIRRHPHRATDQQPVSSKEPSLTSSPGASVHTDCPHLLQLALLPPRAFQLMAFLVMQPQTNVLIGRIPVLLDVKNKREREEPACSGALLGEGKPPWNKRQTGALLLRVLLLRGPAADSTWSSATQAASRAPPRPPESESAR